MHKYTHIFDNHTTCIQRYQQPTGNTYTYGELRETRLGMQTNIQQYGRLREKRTTHVQQYTSIHDQYHKYAQI